MGEEPAADDSQREGRVGRIAGSSVDGSSLNHRRAVAIVATLVAIAPFLVVAATSIGRHLSPVGDIAIIDLRVRDVFTSHSPLLGAYSRFGFSHPGPLMFWLLAPLSFVAGGGAWATYAGAALVQAAGITWSARIGWRRGGVLLALTVLVVQSLSYVALRDAYPWLRPWNPTVAFPFFVVFVLAAWCVGLGELRSLPTVAAVGSALVLTHVGYAPLVGAGVLWVGVALVRQQVFRTRRSEARRAFRWATVITAVLWLPAIIEQLRARAHGNLANLVRSALGQQLPHSTQVSLDRAGWSRGVGVFAAEFRVVPPWLGGTQDRALGGFAVPAPVVFVLIPAVLLVVGIVIGVRTKDRAGLHAVAFASVLAGAGIVTLVQLRGELTEYAFYWRISIALFIVASVVGVVVRSLRFTQRRGGVVVSVVLAAVVVVTSISATARVVRGDRADERVDVVVRSLTNQLERHAWPRDPVVMRQNGDLGLYLGVMVGVFDELHRDGVPSGVSETYAADYLNGRFSLAPRPGQVSMVVTEGASISRLMLLPGAKMRASYSPLGHKDERRLRTLQTRLLGQLGRAGQTNLATVLDAKSPLVLLRVPGVSAADVRQLARLNTRTKFLRYAVIAFTGPLPREVSAL